jgi:hypothetical protein
VWPCISRAGLSIAALFILFASLVLGWSANAADEPRTALVIGNGAYSYGSLANAVTDATDMADALRDVGFEVTLLTDADQRAMDKALTGFSDALSAKGGVGLLYYSGHGVQVDNENYALPIGDELKREDDVKYEAVNIAQVITNLSGAGNSLNIVIIDACRNNPLQSSGRSATRGLARADGGPGLFVSFSTSPGAVALDGDGRNSPFTSHLIRAIRMPGLSLEEAFKETLKGTYTETEGEQLPWISSSFFGDFVFNGSGAEIAPDPPVSVARNMPEEEVTVAARAAGFLPCVWNEPGWIALSGHDVSFDLWRGLPAHVVDRERCLSRDRSTGRAHADRRLEFYGARHLHTQGERCARWRMGRRNGDRNARTIRARCLWDYASHRRRLSRERPQSRWKRLLGDAQDHARVRRLSCSLGRRRTGL